MRWFIVFLILIVLPLGVAQHPTTLVTGKFAQATREWLPAERVPKVTPQTRATDRFGHTFIVSSRGVVIQHASGERHQLEGMPWWNVTSVAMATNGDVWFGSPRGAARWRGGQVEVYAGKRWLADDRVEAIAPQADGSVIVISKGGATRLVWRTMKLADKADHYEQLTDARHKRFGYVTGATLLDPLRPDQSKVTPHIDDNDGLWTAMYVAAESFRYAVTKSPDALRKARESMRAVLDLEKKTGLPGFPARALTNKSEPDFGKPRGGEWHLTADQEWEWKGDTSSDEMDGHFFVWPIYYDLVADDREKADIRATCRRVMDRIIRDGFYLLDLDGKPTTWGVWAPEKINDDPDWRNEKGLNALELLAYLKATEHITGDAKYARVAHELITKHHYAQNTLMQKVLPGDFPDAENNHSDDELAFLSYYPLLRYETDPSLRAIYLASLERSWQIARPEASPFMNFIYGALTGRPCDSEASVRALEEIPLDLVHWLMTNGFRLDLQRDSEPDRFGRPQLRVPLPWRERPLHKWNGNPYVIDGGGDRSEECGTFWLLPYWMARWHGIIR